MQFKRITICVALAFAPGAFAADATEAALPDVEVIGKRSAVSTLPASAPPPAIRQNCSMGSPVSAFTARVAYPACR